MAGDRTAAYACSAERSDRRPTEYKRRRQNGAPAAPQRHARAAASRGTNRPSSWENFPGYSSLILPSLHFAYTRIAQPLTGYRLRLAWLYQLYQAVSGLVARASRLAAVYSVAAVSKYTVIQGATATALHYTVVQCTACYRTVLLCTMLCSAVLCTVKSRPCKKAELSS